MSDRIELGPLRVEGGYFLLKNPRPSRRPMVAGDRTTLGQTNGCRHCFTYERSPSTIHEGVLEMVQRARKKIFIASFRIGEHKLLKALYEAVDRLRGGVYIITALDDRSLARGLTDLDEEAGDDIKVQGKRFEELTRRGIYLRGHSSCHAKFVVVDDQIALISSANLETRAFSVTGENGVLMEDPGEVQTLARFFTRLWHEGCDWEVRPGQTYTVQQRKPTPPSFKAPSSTPCDGATGLPRVIWTCGNEHHILHTIHEVIELARHTLTLATFSLCGMAEQPQLLLEPLERAIKERNVKVRMLLRARNNIQGHRSDAAKLHRIGVQLEADSLNHAKGVVADGRFGALFSANFDAQHGLTNGVEVGVRLDGTSALTEAERYFHFAMEQAEMRFAVDPTHAEMNESLAARWRSPWPHSPTIRVRCPQDDAWEAFRSAALTGTVLYLCRNSGVIQIYAGGGQWHLCGPAMDGVFRLEVQERPRVVSASSTNLILKEWLEARSEDDAPRGCCPATIERVA